MEEGYQGEQAKPHRSYDGLPVLNDPLKRQLSALLTDAATLERRYQAIVDANPHKSESHIEELDRLHRKWLTDRENSSRP
jgi:hypothetical protein